MWLPPIQQKIKTVALSEIIKTTQNQLSIGTLHFRPFNRLQLDEVYAADLHGDTLLYAEKIDAKFDLFRLFDKELLIKSVDLSNFAIHLKKDSLNDDFNFQFLINAFASKSPDTTSLSMIFRIHDIRLNKGRMTYNVLSEPILPDSLFDFNHIRLANISLKTNVHLSDAGDLNIQLHSLSFVEKSGLNVAQLQANIQSAGEKYRLSDVELQLPHSRLSIPNGYYDSTALRLTLGNTKIYLPDLKMFYPLLADFPEDLTLSGEINGTLPQINLTHFQLDYGKHLHLQLQGAIADYDHWQKTPIQLQINASSIDTYMIEQLWHRFSDASKQKLPVYPGNLALNGRIQGTLPHLNLNLTVESNHGAIQLNGNGGHDFRTRETHFNASLQSNSFDVAAFLQDALYGLADLELQVEGKISASGFMHIIANACSDRFDFNGYSYNRIQTDAAYRGDSIRLNISSDDVNLPLEINVCADIGKKNPGLILDARLNHVYLDALNLLSNYKDAFLTGQIRADVNGFDPEKMKMNVHIQNLLLTTDKGSFSEPHFSLTYAATEKNRKILNIISRIVNAEAKGNFTYTGLLKAAKENFPAFFPASKIRSEKNDSLVENFNFRVGMKDINSLSDLLELPRTLPDSALIMGKYNYDGRDMKLSASAYTRFMETDTLQLSLILSNQNNYLGVIFNVDNKSTNYDIDGSMDAEVEFIPKKGRSIPDMNIRFNPTVWVLNETFFNFNTARMEIQEGKYLFHDLLVEYIDNPKEHIRLNGVISTSETDSLTLDISQFQLSTLFGAAKTDIPLSGIVEGKITARRLLSTPFVFTRDFVINQIVFDKNALGDLKVISGWSTQYNGLGLRATLGRKDQTPSVVTGFVLPEKDSLSLQAQIKNIELQWFQKMMAGSLYGLTGSVEADMKISGKLSKPKMNGIVRAKDARVGINQLNTLYSINDSIFFNPNVIELKKFTIFDENKRTLTATGTITHNQFSEFNPNIYLILSDFLVLNNEKQVDSLFYGNLRANGLLTVKKSDRDWLISGDITHSDNAHITVNIPSTASVAERYNHMITFINTESEETKPGVKRTSGHGNEPFSLPLRINASLWFDPSLTIDAIFNPATKDAVHVNGNGMIRLSYDLTTSAVSLLGDYETTSGNVGISLAGIARKTFIVQPGGKLVFHGDPMATTFNLTALYNLRADLSTLDDKFKSVGRTPVSCSLSTTGSIDRMSLTYDILLPSESDDTQREINKLLADKKIQQIAYLLAFGSFMSASNSTPDFGEEQLLNSLAAFTSGRLNQLLASALNDKWSISTDIGLNDAAINVSLNNRLTISGIVGYNINNNNSNGQTNNFTGDFIVEYKLIPSGDLALRAYNVTNNDPFRQALTTQGVGVMYKREARVFRKLFDKFRKKK